MTCICLVLQWIHAQASVYGGVDFTRVSHVKVDLGSRGRCRVLFTPGHLGIISMGPCIWYSSVTTVVAADRLAPICRVLEGYYISHSGKKAIRMVHCLGRCYMLPGVDYLPFCYAGLQFPASDDYDTVRKCEGYRIQGRSGVFRCRYFAVFRRVKVPHEGSVELSAPLSVDDPGSVEPQFR